MSPLLRATGVVAAAALAGCGGGGNGDAQKVTVKLGELVASGQSGTATLTRAGSVQTIVHIQVANPPAEAQPAHIHPGTCEQLDPLPAWALESVVDGESETTLNVGLDELRTGKFAVNIHRSAEEIRTSVACGDIP